MTFDEFEVFLCNNRNSVEWRPGGDDDHIYLHHTQFDKPEEGICLNLKKMENLTPELLESQLVNGRNVDHLTRITGYFSKVSGWNKGKTGELKDRHRSSLNEFNPQ